MQLQKWRALNIIIAVLVVLVVAVMGLTGFCRIRETVRLATKDAGSHGMHTLEFTQAFQEHAAVLMAVNSTREKSDLAAKEGELKETLERLRTLGSPGGFGGAVADETIADVEKLTEEMLTSTRKRIQAERQVSGLAEAVKAQTRMMAVNRAVIRSSWENLQEEGRETQLGLLADADAAAERAEKLMAKNEAMMEALKRADAARARSAELGARLANLVETERSVTARTAAEAIERQSQSAEALSSSITWATALLIGCIALAMALGAVLVNSRPKTSKESKPTDEASEGAGRTRFEFLAGVSREIKAPINELMGLLQVLKERLFPGNRAYTSRRPVYRRRPLQMLSTNSSALSMELKRCM